MRAALAVHPDAGLGAAARLAVPVAAALRARSLDLVRERPPDDTDLLVVLGGDGSVHHAVQFCAETGTALGVIPAGCGNDFARALGIPADPRAALAALLDAVRTGRRRRIDLGKAGRTWFGSVLCAGFDAAVAQRGSRLRWPRGRRRYDVAVLAELGRFRARPLTVCTEDGKLELDALSIAVGNTGSYGGAIPICPDADPADGLFDVTVIGQAGRLDLLRLLPGLRAGAHLNHPAVRTFRAREIHLDGEDRPVCADGEPQPGLPLSARCVPGALTVVA
ncbi:sphingosine kinase [Amycolatopsis acidicola]|uniref:Sphingosine kinase n=1 Tax=Amycolatopsis acidicola TaxID=2596893 RepID=A0A5N0URV7_9PSEU|nr:diacylglycerol kinase family protein [Amycolatopsis acidicola]KAA9152183.1 sphingosine kinase [Amycolatopsis acidicola]